MELQHLIAQQDLEQIDWIGLSGDGGSCKKTRDEAFELSKKRGFKYVFVQLKDGRNLRFCGTNNAENKPDYSPRKED
jgi:hypothetical protein